MGRFPPGTSAEEMSAALEDARRQSRFKAAEERIKRIVDGAPPLTPAQRERLALLLHPGVGGGNG
ncbi:MAG TPA: hypothetical protein VGD83_24760 [Streptosporangiaceae bacterium]